MTTPEPGEPRRNAAARLPRAFIPSAPGALRRQWLARCLSPLSAATGRSSTLRPALYLPSRPPGKDFAPNPRPGRSVAPDQREMRAAD